MYKVRHKTKRNLLLCLICILCVSLSGCWDQQILGRIRLDLDISTEKGEGGSLLITRTSPIFEEVVQSKTDILSANVESLRESRGDIGTISPYSAVGGNPKQLLISRDLAEEGISSILEVGYRNLLNPVVNFMVIVDGSPKELLEEGNKLQDKPQISVYLNRLLESNAKAYATPNTRVYNVYRDYFAPGIDPILPRIKLENGDDKGVRVMGSALFSGDKLVGELDTGKTSLLLLMMDKIKKGGSISQKVGLLTAEQRIGSSVGFDISKVKRKIDVKIEDNKALVNISLKVSGTLTDYNWGSISNKEVENSLEAQFSKALKERCSEVIKDTQKFGSDPIGIGEIVRAKYNDYWKSVKWEEAYKKADIKVDIVYNINNYGAIK